MIIRHAVRIDGGAFEKRGKIGTGDIRPNKFVEQDDADAERLNLGYRRLKIVPGYQVYRRDRARDYRGLARLGSIRPTVGGHTMIGQLTGSGRQIVEPCPQVVLGGSDLDLLPGMDIVKPLGLAAC